MTSQLGTGIPFFAEYRKRANKSYFQADRHKQLISFMKISDVTCYGLQRSVKLNELQNMFKIRYHHLRKRSIKDTFRDSYLWCIKLAGLKPRPLVRVRGEFYYSRLPAQDTMLQAPIVPKRLRTIINNATSSAIGGSSQQYFLLAPMSH